MHQYGSSLAPMLAETRGEIQCQRGAKGTAAEDIKGCTNEKAC